MPIAAPDSTLQAIQNKVRRLTRSPSESEITNADLQNYINTFVVYDFPEQLRTFNLRQSFTFYTNPFQDVYPTDTLSFGNNPAAVNNPLYDFQNKYLTVHPPFYVAGFPTSYTQSREQFYQYFPKLNYIAQTGLLGDGTLNNFSGVIQTQQVNPQLPIVGVQRQSIGLLQNQVLFSSLDTDMNGLALVDIPLINPTTGNNTIYGNLYDPNSQLYQDIKRGYDDSGNVVYPPSYPTGAFSAPFNLGTGAINYSTGAYTAVFSASPGEDQYIISQAIPTNLYKPTSVCFSADEFILRPIPDQVYRVDLEVYVRPTWLMETSSMPALQEYWQYIAYGAAKKIFEDRMDIDSVKLITPEFKTQEMLVMRRTIVQYTNEAQQTIYQSNSGNGNSGSFGMGNW